jgi:hypothetical protein
MRDFLPVSQYRAKRTAFSESVFNTKEFSSDTLAAGLMKGCHRTYLPSMDIAGIHYSMWHHRSEHWLRSLPKVRAWAQLTARSRRITYD